MVDLLPDKSSRENKLSALHLIQTLALLENAHELDFYSALAGKNTHQLLKTASTHQETISNACRL